MSNIFDLFKKIESPSSSHTPITHLVVGLGNPGDEYRLNRHNAGFMALDYGSQKCGASVTRLKFKSLCGEATLCGKRVLLMKPQTYMNHSGEAVREAADFYHIPPENIIVIFDDISLDPGKLRIRRSGSAGGHNGVKSLIEHLDTNAFPRIKLGVGDKPSKDYPLADWVLGNIPKAQQEDFFACLIKAWEALELMLSDDIDRAMSLYN